MKLNNTLTRSADTFAPLNDNTVSLYSCGPTVYDYPHLGNWSSYLRWDILARTLRQHYKLDWYMNLTDVGHLVSDADEGEDKLEKGARREGKSAWDIASFYSDDFIKGLDTLNISIDLDHLVKATDHIAEQIQLIRKLEEKGFTYQIDDGVYFDSTKFADYGKMAKLDLAGLKAGARVDLGQKKNPSDFALWKSAPGEKRDMEWESPWGKGFPGWHIECSAMAMKYLGATIDIHTGGIDHIPIHHTNEIAQSEAATGQQFVRFWLHNNFLQVDGVKISKSLGNFITLHDLQNKGFTAQDFRMFVLQSHYQTEANFTWEGMQAAQTRLKELQAFADLRYQISEKGADIAGRLKEAAESLQAALDDDLNTPQALAVLSGIINSLQGQTAGTGSLEALQSLLATVDELLGFDLLSTSDINEHQKHMISDRQTARGMKDWTLSDTLRDQMLSEGIALRDTPHGTVWERV
jgi:cysteinyl-tRNA synthetase